jgi:hypothetical protein
MNDNNTTQKTKHWTSRTSRNTMGELSSCPLLTSCLSISFQWESDIPIPVVPSLPHMYIITILLNVFSSNTAHITLSKNKVIKLLVAPVVSKFT